MRIGPPLEFGTALLLTLLAGGQVSLAQTGRTWVDPPSAPEAPSRASPQAAEPPKPAPPAEPAPSARTAAPQAAAPSPPAAPPSQSAQPANPVPAPETPPTRQSARPSAPAAPAAPEREAQRKPDQEKRTVHADAAKAFAISYLNAWSSSNDEALESTAEFYAPEVLFHGRTMSMKRLFNEKKRFVRRWPQREYRPREDAMGIVCNPSGDLCTVHAVFDYEAANPARKRYSQGTGALQLIVQFIGEKPIIVSENSTLLSQKRKRNLVLEGTSND